MHDYNMARPTAIIKLDSQTRQDINIIDGLHPHLLLVILPMFGQTYKPIHGRFCRLVQQFYPIRFQIRPTTNHLPDSTHMDIHLSMV